MPDALHSAIAGIDKEQQKKALLHAHENRAAAVLKCPVNPELEPPQRLKMKVLRAQGSFVLYRKYRRMLLGVISAGMIDSGFVHYRQFSHPIRSVQ